MEKEVLEKYVRAGKICWETRKAVLKAIRPGARIIDIAELVEGRIKEMGAKPAFPVNISINDIAAHYTPIHNDGITVAESDLVKIDIGAMVDGYIGDTAFTYCSEESELVKGAEEALKAGIKAVRPGASVSEVSAAIEDRVRELGLGVIVNLTGHGLDRYVFHGIPTIPNVRNKNSHAFREGDVIALEPFVLQSNGQVKDSKTVEIYRYLTDRPVRMPEARKIIAMAREDFSGLPFAKRWLYSHFSPVKISMGLKQLEMAGAIETYPVLREIQGRKIAQAEHTIIVSDKPIITTRGE